MDHLDALDVATAEFGRRLSGVEPAQWEMPTPCEEWNVRYLVAHVVGGNRFAALVLAGGSARAALERIMSTPQVGDDPVADHDDSVDAQRLAFRVPGRLEGTVDHPVGEITARRFLSFRVLDIAVHTWDLARAIGHDPRLDRGLVDEALRIVEAAPDPSSNPATSRAGPAATTDAMGFGPAPARRSLGTLPPQARLLHLTGRDPR